MMFKKYCFDTSAFIQPWIEHYPIDIFPSVWSKLDELIQTNEIISSEEVLREIKRKDDELLSWIKRNSNMFMDIDNDIQFEVSKIMRTFPKLVDERHGKSIADPFVIATAIITKTTVVTYEKGGNQNRPKIPSVCKYFNIRCIQEFSVFLREIKFQL